MSWRNLLVLDQLYLFDFSRMLDSDWTHSSLYIKLCFELSRWTVSSEYFFSVFDWTRVFSILCRSWQEDSQHHDLHFLLCRRPVLPSCLNFVSDQRRVSG